jgi:hypothetical protein
MTFARAILALLISVGLALAPVAAALPAKAQALSQAMAMPDCPSHAKAKPAAQGDHPCCDHSGAMARCAAALCALKCFKIVAAFDAPMGRSSSTRLHVAPVATTNETASFGWRPPIPPPRA